MGDIGQVEFWNILAGGSWSELVSGWDARAQIGLGSLLIPSLLITGEEGQSAHRRLEESLDALPRIFGPGSMASTAF